MVYSVQIFNNMVLIDKNFRTLRELITMHATSEKLVGVIVARFQVPKLHEGHRYIIDCVSKAHDDVLIILGTAPLSSDRNALSFEMRKGMIEQEFPFKKFIILSSNSLPSSHQERSRIIDEMITAAFPDRDAVVYGSRDSFIHTYHGRFPKQEIKTVYGGSATEIRKNIGIINSPDFRAGVIYSAIHRKPHSHPSVDVAVLDHTRQKVLLVGKRAEEGLLRFPGVFFNPELDVSYEAAAERCVEKEIQGITTVGGDILGSCLIDDWRCKKTANRIITLLTTTTYHGGEPAPGAGVDEVAWVSMCFLKDAVVDCHQPLVAILTKHLTKS